MAETEKDGGLQGLVRISMREAVTHHADNLEPIMEEASEYYHGEPFGDEEEGRSQVVSRDVHDVTQGQLPSLLRIFFGTEDPVEFRPRGPEDVPIARQQTDYIRYVISEENDGYVQFHAAMHDALVRRFGAWKWWFEKSDRVMVSRHKGLDRQSLMALMQDVAVEDIEVESVEADEEGAELVNIRVQRREPHGAIRFEAIPPEEVVWTPGSRSLKTAPLVAHYREATREEMQALGIDGDLIDEAVTTQKEHTEGVEQTRLWAKNTEPKKDVTVSESQETAPFAEAYMLVEDEDGDVGLRMFYLVGDTFTIGNGNGEGEIVDELPMSIITPYLEPHTIVGHGNYDELKDIQRIKSQVFRGTLNSLAASVEPSIAAQDGMVNMTDLINPEISGLIRTHANPNEVLRDFSHNFIGHATLPVLQYLDEMRQARSGWDQSSAGLDPEALQSSTRTGVAAHLQASQQRIEMIARTFAETGVKDLYKGLLRMVVKYRNRRDMLKLRGEWVEVDPRHWVADMDVQVNVAIGRGTIEERRAFLMTVLEGQQQLQQMGSPLVGNVEIRYTLGELLKLSGREDADRMFKPWGAEQEQEYQQQLAQQPPQPDPAMILAQIEQAKVQQKQQSDQLKQQIEMQKQQQSMQIEQAKLELEKAKLELEREKLAQQSALEEKKLELEHQREILAEEMKAQMETYKVGQEADLRRQDMETRREEARRQRTAVRPSPAPAGPPVSPEEPPVSPGEPPVMPEPGPDLSEEV